MYEYLVEKIKSFEYKGVPVNPDIGVPASFLAGSGVPFTTACKLRGTTQMCMDMLLDPEYVKELLSYITEAIIVRTRAWRKYLSLPEKMDPVFLGDDSCVLLSPEMYREFVMPFHKRLYEEFGTKNASRAIHLCGKAFNHFLIMGRELGVTIFDTGFPINLRELYEQLGSHIIVQGGVHVELLRGGTEEEIVNKSREILEELKPYKKFIFRDANSVAPLTPVSNLKAMYEACRKYGRYQ